ncbi:MAG: S-methyl-5'-thioadenosine phosphorylase [Bacteroidales bacterium]
MIRIGIIGGSGLENPDILQSSEEKNAETPYGAPSSSLLSGSVNGREIVILSRHGRLHTIPPSKVNNRANIFALKEAGCTHIISSTACGSLREEIFRGDIVVPDQFIDFTRHRNITFFEEFKPGKMNHTPMADPFDDSLRNSIISTGHSMALKIHEKGTVVTIEGPRFSTRAESRMFRIWGADIINMSIAPEVILANELGIPYAAIALCTDYDSWKENEIPVTWEEVIDVFNRNVNNVLRLIMEVIRVIR